MTTQTTASTVRSADGTTIAFEATGTGQPLIMVDAALGFRGFNPMGELPGLLVGAFTVVSYDRRGRGESTDTPPYAVEREVEDLAALIDEAGSSAFVYGFSSGAVLALHAAGRRGDAVERFNRSIGIPEEMVAGMRDAPFFPTLEKIAHTPVYDTTITKSVTPDLLASIATPTLVVGSAASGDYLQASGRAVADALPNGRFQGLKGEWHGVPPEDLAPVLTKFFKGEDPR